MEIPKSAGLTIFLTAFALVTIAYRCWDAFLRKFGVSGKVYYAWTLTLLAVIHTVIGLVSLIEYFIVVRTYNVVVGVISFCGFLSGQLLRNWAIASLGDLHSQQIEIKPGHQLIKRGPYLWLRDPYYLGAIFEVICIPLIFNSYFSFFIAVLTYVPAICIRAVLEDEILSQYFNRCRNKI